MNLDLKELTIGELNEANGGVACSKSILGICICGVAATVVKTLDEMGNSFSGGVKKGYESFNIH